MADESPSCARLLDAFVHAPIGLALYARDTAPGFLRLFVARGRDAVGYQQHRVDATVNQARSIGELAVTYGVPEVRRRVEGGMARARDVAEGVISARTPTRHPGDGAQPRVAEDSRDRTSPSDREVAPSSARPRVDESRVASRPAPKPTALPIPDYDELSASQVVERLEGLAPHELDAVAKYEAAQRGRRTILGKIENLTT